MKGEKNNVCTCAYRRNNFELSRICCNRLHVDPLRDYGADHVHSWESVPCSWFGSLYVWCRDLVLHSHQKCLRGFLALFCILFFAFPAYAEDGDFIYADHVFTINRTSSSFGTIRATLNVYSDSIVLASVDPSDLFDGYSFYQIVLSIPDRSDQVYNYYFNTVGTRKILDSDIDNYNTCQGRVIVIDPDNNQVGVNLSLISNFPPVSDGTLDYETATGIADYLTNTGSVFTWLLTTMGSLITWIFGNAFLAVLFCLFVAGTVISFFVRVRQ